MSFTKEQIQTLADAYGVGPFETCREIDSSKPGDFRLNLILDKKYVLRINDPVITEDRLAAIDRLAGRYCAMGVRAPRLIRSRSGAYLTPWGDRVCYLSEYLDAPTLSEVRDTLTDAQVEEIRRSVLVMMGRFSRKYTGVDLQPVYSMWSVFDLAPLDVDVDEKQENLNDLASALIQAGAAETADRVVRFNEENRRKIQEVFSLLPCCVIQGDLNDSNLLVSDGQFSGLIDFNMAGTEVNVNLFCCETNEGIEESALENLSPAELLAQMDRTAQKKLAVILEQYPLNELESRVLRNFQNLVSISQFPNVCLYRRGLQSHREKTVALIEEIVRQPV